MEQIQQGLRFDKSMYINIGIICITSGPSHFRTGALLILNTLLKNCGRYILKHSGPLRLRMGINGMPMSLTKIIIQIDPVNLIYSLLPVARMRYILSKTIPGRCNKNNFF